MKRNHIRYMLLLLPVLLLAGCENPMDDHGPDAPDGPATFTATIGSAATKTLLAGQAGGTRPVYWAADDSVCIGGAIYRVSSITATDSTQAVFTGNGAQPESNKYKAFYPASLYDNRTLPAEQTYGAIDSETKRTNIAHLPMYAESNSTSLTFHNLCTVLNVRLSRAFSSSAKVTKVVVTSASKNLSGPFEVVSDGAGFKAKMKDSDPAASNQVTLNCGGTSGVNLNANTPTEFCIAIPAGDYPQYDLTIKVYNGSTEIASFTNLDAGTSNLGRSKMLDLEKPVTMSFRIKTRNDNYELALPFVANARLSSAVEVDWGDRGPTDPTDTYPSRSNANLMKHVYANAGDYDVTLKFLAFDAMMPEMVFSNTNFRQVLTALTSPLPLMTNAAGSAVVTDASQMFTHCSALTTIHPDLFINNPQLTNFYCTFYKCSSLTAIPETLFAPCQNATNFHGTFSGCSSLTGEIPGNLFANNTKVTTFQETFTWCSSLTGEIPGNLFANNPEVTSFDCTFYKCSSLTTIPETLFAPCQNATNFHGTFSGCSSLTGEIPENLFANNTKAERFDNTFENCSSLTGSIPGNLFAYNPEVTSFSKVFLGCEKLAGSIPENLFANNTKVTTFESTFENCKRLTGSIPENLFAYNMKVTTFYSTFQNCSSLEQRIPGNLFANNTKVKSFVGTFSGCVKLEGPIPGNLFANNPEVTNFSYVFNNDSTNLNGPIPEDLFANNPDVESFIQTFYNCQKLQGPLPAGLFRNNKKVKHFTYTFGKCHSLDGEIPAGFFKNNTAAWTFQNTFNSCRKLKFNRYVFVDPNDPKPYTRFADEYFDLRGCFSYVSAALPDSDNPLGSVPRLWDPNEYTLHQPIDTVSQIGDGTKANRRPFQGIHAQDYSGIPDEWKVFTEE